MGPDEQRLLGALRCLLLNLKLNTICEDGRTMLFVPLGGVTESGEDKHNLLENKGIKLNPHDVYNLLHFVEI